jgi:hypothetical protein
MLVLISGEFVGSRSLAAQEIFLSNLQMTLNAMKDFSKGRQFQLTKLL